MRGRTCTCPPSSAFRGSVQMPGRVEQLAGIGVDERIELFPPPGGQDRAQSIEVSGFPLEQVDRLFEILDQDVECRASLHLAGEPALLALPRLEPRKITCGFWNIFCSCAGGGSSSAPSDPRR
jgi:hypothetical protein